MNTGARARWIASVLAAPLAASGCLKIEHKVDPIQVQPIYATLDINLKIDRQLDDFFDFERPPSPSATQPTPGPAANHTAAPHPTAAGETRTNGG